MGSASVFSMFGLSGCTDTSDPNLASTAISPLCHYCPINTKPELLAAIDAWIVSNGTDTRYGPTINDWDVSGVDDFSDLFNGRSSFNDDISGWQTAQGGDRAHRDSRIVGAGCGAIGAICALTRLKKAKKQACKGDQPETIY